MSKIRELISADDSVLVFDIDGVLAIMEWGEYNHYEVDDEEWTKICAQGINLYLEDKVNKKLQDFLKTKDMSKIYVITTVGNDNEGKFKIEFANKYYNIPKENVFFVMKNTEKIEKLIEIKNMYPDIEDYKIAMVEDTVDILNEIMEKTKFSTIHISSFFNIV